MANVIIIGGGVVGLSLARELAALGVHPEVYERKRDVAHGAAKASGIVSVRGLESSGMPYSGSIINRLYGADLYARGRVLRIRAAKTQAYLLDRAMLAQACERAARDAGARIRKGSALSRRAIEKLISDPENIVVGADGAVSTVASAARFPPIRRYVLTYKVEYSGAHVANTGVVGLLFSKSIAPGLFGWYAPHSASTLELGVGVEAGARFTSAAAFSSLIAGSPFGGMVAGAKRANGFASMIPLAARRTTVRRNVLLVGDAAGHVKATTGGGIVFGVACAKEAARAIADHIHAGKPLARYEHMWRSKYGRELAAHGMLHSIYSNAGDAGMEAVLLTSALLGMEGFLSRYGDMDRPLLTLRRFFTMKRGS